MPKYLWQLPFMLSIIYGGIFFYTDKVSHLSPKSYHASLPEPIQYASSNYLRQLFADMLLIKTKVFTGGLAPGVDPLLYGDALAQDFITIAQLHPKLLDTYFIGESSLSWISPYHARQANIMLDVGLKARPDQWIIPFFLGFNHYFYLEEKSYAVAYLNTAYQQGSPSWVRHLSTKLAAENGQLLVGFAWLKAMYQDEKNPIRKLHYKKELNDFSNAILVEQALNRYYETFQKYPKTLEELVPNFLQKIPLKGFFHDFKYQNHKIKLYRQKS